MLINSLNINSLITNHKLRLYTLIEIKANPDLNNIKHEISNKITILEHLAAPEVKEEVKQTVLEEFKNYDKDLKTLTYKVLLEKFNGKYDNLIPEQKVILKELITSIDNTPRLKEFYNCKVNEIKTTLTELNSKVKDKTVFALASVKFVFFDKVSYNLYSLPNSVFTKYSFNIFLAGESFPSRVSAVICRTSNSKSIPEFLYFECFIFIPWALVYL